MPVQSRPEAHTNHAPAGDGAAQTIEEVFLTPRVLDRRAFEDYTESLKSLIRDASGQGQTLSRTAADVRVLRDQLAGATADAQKRLDAVLKALAAAEQRVADLPAVPAPPAATGAARGAGRAKAAEPSRTEAVSTDLLRAIETRLEKRLDQEIEARVAQRVDALAGARLQALIDAAIATAAVPAAQAAAAPLMERAERSIEAAASEAQARLERLVGEARASVDAAVARVESLAASIEASARPAAEPDAAAIEHAAELAADRASARLAERAAGFERAVESAARRFAAETNEQGSRVTAQARQAIEQAREECEAAVRQITTGASLRVRKAQQDADAAMEAMDGDVRSRLEAARTQFDEMLRALTAESQERGAWIRAAMSELSGPRVDQLRSLLDQAAAQADPGVETSLAAAMARAESLRAGVQASQEQIGELGKQVGLMRDLLARSILEGVGRIDALDARQEELLASTARAIEQYAHEIDTLRAGMAAATARAPEVGQAAADAVPGADGALARAEERLDALRQQTEEASQAAEWLGGLIDRAARAGIALDQAVTAPAAEPAPKATRRRGESRGG